MFAVFASSKSNNFESDTIYTTIYASVKEAGL